MANNLPCRGRKIGDRQVAWSLEFDFCVGRLRGRWSFLLNNFGADKITRIHGGYLRSPAVPRATVPDRREVVLALPPKLPLITLEEGL